MKIRYWGVRGSVPSPSTEVRGFYTQKYGGNTSCVEVMLPGHEIILDAGTGIKPLGNELMKRGFAPGEDKKGHGELYVLLSHTHWDHIQGFPFFVPAYIEGNKIHVYAQQKDVEEMKRQMPTTRQAMAHQQQFPYFPVPLEGLRATLDFTDVIPGNTIKLDGVTISTAEVNHPNGCIAYRIEYGGKSLAYATDNQPTAVANTPNYRSNIIKVANQADILIHDGQYTPEEYDNGKEHWGHSTYEHAVQNAVIANARKLVLFHHEPEYDDRKLDGLANRAHDYLASYIPMHRKDLNSIDLLIAREGTEDSL
ncbi:MAG: MBL fold metallo-hydrolase [Candidatus Aenigmarchaeota archaeon]|nr:MBL fold metallo-hydrolase [Candidatus Aenigmarchaeota archaeon]